MNDQPTFHFHAQEIGTDRRVSVTVSVNDDGRPFAELADDAAETAAVIAAGRLGCEEDHLEVVQVG